MMEIVHLLRFFNVSEEWRAKTRKRLILETRDIEDTVELNNRHVRFDDRTGNVTIVCM